MSTDILFAMIYILLVGVTLILAFAISSIKDEQKAITKRLDAIERKLSALPASEQEGGAE